MLQHFFSSTLLLYLCVTWFHKPWRQGHNLARQEFEVQSSEFNLAGARTCNSLMQYSSTCRRSCTASCVGQEHS